MPDGQILLRIYLKKPICPQKRVKEAALKDYSLQSPLRAPTLTSVRGSGGHHTMTEPSCIALSKNRKRDPGIGGPARISGRDDGDIPAGRSRGIADILLSPHKIPVRSVIGRDCPGNLWIFVRSARSQCKINRR